EAAVDIHKDVTARGQGDSPAVAGRGSAGCRYRETGGYTVDNDVCQRPCERPLIGDADNSTGTGIMAVCAERKGAIQDLNARASQSYCAAREGNGKSRCGIHVEAAGRSIDGQQPLPGVECNVAARTTERSTGGGRGNQASV